MDINKYRWLDDSIQSMLALTCRHQVIWRRQGECKRIDLLLVTIDSGEGLRVSPAFFQGLYSARDCQDLFFSGSDVLNILEFIAGSFPGFFQVVVSLQSHPELFRGAQGTGKPESGICCDGTIAVDDFIDASRWNAHGTSEAILADAHWIKKLFKQDLFN